MKSLSWLIALASCLLVSAGCGGEGPTAGSTLDLPAVVEGTTSNAKRGDGDPECGQPGPTIWYRVATDDKSRIALRFHAGGDLEATVCAMREGSSGFTDVKRDATDERGMPASTSTEKPASPTSWP